MRSQVSCADRDPHCQLGILLDELVLHLWSQFSSDTDWYFYGKQNIWGTEQYNPLDFLFISRRYSPCRSRVRPEVSLLQCRSVSRTSIHSNCSLVWSTWRACVRCRPQSLQHVRLPALAESLESIVECVSCSICCEMYQLTGVGEKVWPKFLCVCTIFISVHAHTCHLTEYLLYVNDVFCSV